MAANLLIDNGGGVSSIAPASYAVAVTPNDSTDLAITSRGLLVTTTGVVTLVLAETNTAVTFPLAGGIVHPLRVKRVYSTGNTCGNIIALY